MIKAQDQSVGTGSTAIQAGGDVVINSTGLTYLEVKEVALDVFRSNFAALAGIARDTANARAEEITDDFLSKLQKENPEALQNANDPGFQYSLLEVQKQYARTGDQDLGDLLVDLLVDRSKQPQRDILQIVLDESLNTAPKLTGDQLSSMSIAFLFRHAQWEGLANIEVLGQCFDQFVLPFAEQISTRDASYQHLEFAGCGSVGMNSITLESIIVQRYQGLFMKGFEEKDALERGLSMARYARLIGLCLNDQSKLQVMSLNKDSLSQGLEKSDVPQGDRQKIMELFEVNKMREDEVRSKCTEVRPYMANVFMNWSNSGLKNFSLTSVGIAIAHANIKRLAGDFADLSIWIN